MFQTALQRHTTDFDRGTHGEAGLVEGDLLHHVAALDANLLLRDEMFYDDISHVLPGDHAQMLQPHILTRYTMSSTPPPWRPKPPMSQRLICKVETVAVRQGGENYTIDTSPNDRR